MKETHIIVISFTVLVYIVAIFTIINNEVENPIQFLLVGVPIVGSIDFLFLNWEYKWIFVSKLQKVKNVE